MSAPQPILILAADATAGALLGMLAELARYVPVFPGKDEGADEALARLRPVLVLLDGSRDEAQSDLFSRSAAKRRVGLAIFGAPPQSEEAARRATRHQVPYADVPRSLEAFQALADAARTGRQRRTGSRRSEAAEAAAVEDGSRTERDRDGTLIYYDSAGRRWSVYDRRGSERRRTPKAREFVAENGETWTYALAASEVHARTPMDLGRQLAQAVRA